MKTKLVITIALCISTLILNAQTEKGSFLLGGSLGYSTNKSKTDFSSHQRNSFFIISPKIGYFIENNFAIGTKLSYSITRYRLLDSPYDPAPQIWNRGDKKNAYGISPFARYYVNLTEMLKFYGELEVSFETGKIKSTTNNIEDSQKFHNYRPAVSPGLVLFPSKKWAIEFSFPLLSYERKTFSRSALGITKSSSNLLNFGLNTFNPNLGVNFHF